MPPSDRDDARRELAALLTAADLASAVEAVPATLVPALVGLASAEHLRLAAVTGALAGRLAAPASKATSTPSALLSIEQVAERIGLSVTWVRHHWRGITGARKIGSRVVFDPAGLARWLDGRRAP